MTSHTKGLKAVKVMATAVIAGGMALGAADVIYFIHETLIDKMPDPVIFIPTAFSGAMALITGVNGRKWAEKILRKSPK